MLERLLFSFICGVCSTVVIQPWFWKSLIKRKTLVGDKDHRGWNEGEIKDCIILQIVFALVTFVLSIIYYSLPLISTDTWFSFSAPIDFVLLFQTINMSLGWNENTGKKSVYLLVLVAIHAIILFFLGTKQF